MPAGTHFHCLSFLLLWLVAGTAHTPNSRNSPAFLDLRGHRQICIYSCKDERFSSPGDVVRSALMQGAKQSFLGCTVL